MEEQKKRGRGRPKVNTPERALKVAEERIKKIQREANVEEPVVKNKGGRPKKTELIHTESNHATKKIPYKPAAPEIMNADPSTLSATDQKRRRIAMHSLHMMQLPFIDLNDVEAVRKRISDYFQLAIDDGITPTVEDFAIALNWCNRQTLFRYCTGEIKLKPEVKTMIEGVKNQLVNNLTMGMLEGTVKEITGIFLLKNNHNYVDRQEHVMAQSNPLGEGQTAEQIADKYRDIVIDEIPEETGTNEE